MNKSSNWTRGWVPQEGRWMYRDKLGTGVITHNLRRIGSKVFGQFAKKAGQRALQKTRDRAGDTAAKFTADKVAQAVAKFKNRKALLNQSQNGQTQRNKHDMRSTSIGQWQSRQTHRHPNTSKWLESQEQEDDKEVGSISSKCERVREYFFLEKLKNS